MLTLTNPILFEYDCIASIEDQITVLGKMRTVNLVLLTNPGQAMLEMLKRSMSVFQSKANVMELKDGLELTGRKEKVRVGVQSKMLEEFHFLSIGDGYACSPI